MFRKRHKPEYVDTCKEHIAICNRVARIEGEVVIILLLLAAIAAKLFA